MTKNNQPLIERIENAERRIIELRILIKHWREKSDRTMDNTGAEIR